MIRLVIVSLAVAMAGYASPLVAHADDCGGLAQAGSVNWNVLVQCHDAEEPGPVHTGANQSTGDVASMPYTPVCELPSVLQGTGLQGGCGEPIRCGDNDVGVMAIVELAEAGESVGGGQCIFPAGAPAEAAPPQVTPGMVAAAFRRVPLPNSELTIAPPGGKTLVGLDTILSTEAEPFTEVVTLLGQRVELDIEPAQFAWVHGDGTSQTTDSPGVPYAEGRPMSDYIAHRYSTVTAQLGLRVDTTWAARFRVNGGPWQDVGETVTIEGPPVGLEVVEAEPNLVGS